MFTLRKKVTLRTASTLLQSIFYFLFFKTVFCNQQAFTLRVQKLSLFSQKGAPQKRLAFNTRLFPKPGRCLKWNRLPMNMFHIHFQIPFNRPRQPNQPGKTAFL
jgi:hypothetical protein